jgi:hypothetical protein
LIVALALQYVAIYNVKVEKIVLRVQTIADYALLLTPTVATDAAIQVAGKTAPHVLPIVVHVHTIPLVVMVLVIRIMGKIVTPVSMIVGNAPLQARIVEMERVSETLVKHVARAE